MPVNRHSGFTLVELVIAMTIFSFLLLAMSSSVIRLYAIYEAGGEIRGTQQTARQVSEQISTDTRNANTLVVGSYGGISDLCLFQPPVQLGGTNADWTVVGVKYYIQTDPSNPRIKRLHRLTSSIHTTTAPTDCNFTGGTDEMISGAKQSVWDFWVSQISNRLVSVTLSVVAENGIDFLDLSVPSSANNPVSCKPQSGSQYCSVTSVQTAAMISQEDSR